MDNLYTKKDLLQALRIAAKAYPRLKIGASYEALLRYEKIGVIVRPDSPVASSIWRFYTSSQIEEVVRRIIAFKKAKKEKSAKTSSANATKPQSNL